jgi:DNA-binding cell septation regulator SpoVG
MVVQYITEIKVYPVTGSESLLARGSFVVADALAVNFSVFRGKDGTPRVVLPNSPNPKFDPSKPISKDNKKFYDEVRPITKDRRDELEAYIISELNGSEVVSTESPIPF